MRLSKFAYDLIELKEVLNKNSNPLIRESLMKSLDEIRSSDKIDENVYVAILNGDISEHEFTSLLKDYPNFMKSKKEIASDMSEARKLIEESINKEICAKGESINTKIEPIYDEEKFKIISYLAIPQNFFYEYFAIEGKEIKKSTLSIFYDMFIVLRIEKYLERFFDKNCSGNKLKYTCLNLLKNEIEDFERIIPIKREMTLTEYYNENVRNIIISEIVATFTNLSHYFKSLSEIEQTQLL